MTAFSARRVGFALVAAATLAAGLSTGTRFYYLVFLLLAVFLMLVFLPLVPLFFLLQEHYHEDAQTYKLTLDVEQKNLLS